MISPVESAPPVLSEGPEPDVFLGLVPSGVSVVSAPSLGGSDEGSAGRLVQGAGEARGLDEGLDEHGRGVVALGPVVGQLPADQGEDVRAQVGDRDPGQDQEPRVVDDEWEVLLAQLRRPSDEAVAGRELACRRAEAEHGDRRAVAVVDGVAHLGTDQGLVTEVVVAGDELVPPLALARVARDGPQAERADLIEGGWRRERRRFGVRSEDHGPARRAWPFRRRQDDQPVLVHGQHGHPGHHVLESTVRLEPADAPAELPGQCMAVGRRRGGDQRAQQLHFCGNEVAPVVAALDVGGHPCAISSRLRSSLIDHGSHGDRSSGGWPPFFAQA